MNNLYTPASVRSNQSFDLLATVGAAARSLYGSKTVASASSQQPSWLASILASNDQRRIYLNEKLVSDVFLHVAMNHDPIYAEAMPLMLGVNGVFGCGKTVSVRETLLRIGCELIEIHAAELESPHAGAPSQLILARYVEASKRQMETDRPHVIVMDDVHMALSVGPRTTNTINTQLVQAALMNICDNAHHVAGVRTERIPIITTGNSYSGIYGALIRAGRMRVVSHELSAEDRARIAIHILRGFLAPKQVVGLAFDHPDWELATFQQLKAMLQRRSFNRRHANKPADRILRDLLSQGPIAGSNGIGQEGCTKEDIDAAVKAVVDEAASKRDFTRAGHPTKEPERGYKETINDDDKGPHTDRTPASVGGAGDAEHDRTERQVPDPARHC